ERGVSASLGLAYATEIAFVPARAELRAAAEAACREAKQRGGACGIIAGHGVVTEPQPHDSDPASLLPLDAAEFRAHGRRIRHKHEGLGWTRRDLAAACESDPALIRDLELGRRRIDRTLRVHMEACLDEALRKPGSTPKKR